VRARQIARSVGALIPESSGCASIARKAQDRLRIALEEAGVDRVEQPADVAELVVDRFGLAGVLREELGLEVLDQQRRQLGHRLRGPVETLHQLLARQPRVLGVEAHRARHLRLQVEDQPVLAAAGHDVQPRADDLQLALVSGEQGGLGPGRQAAGGELPPAAADPCRPRDPEDRLQVAQPARALLDVRLEAVRRVLELHVPLAQLEQLRVEERASVERRVEALAQPRVQAAPTGQPAPFEQAGPDGDVAGRFGEALLHGAHAVPDLQAHVPAGTDEAFQPGEPVGILGRRHQQQQVDVGVRQQLASAVAADGHQRAVGLQAGVAPEREQHRVGDADDAAQQRPDVAAGAEGFDQCRAAGPERRTQRGDIDGTAVGAGQRVGRDRDGGVHPGGRRDRVRPPPAAARDGRARRRRSSAPRGRCRSPAPCAPTAPTGCGPW
jgi:hypothetical protein